jgi:hypothetical protein
MRIVLAATMIFVSIGSYSSCLNVKAEPFDEFLERFIIAFNEKNTAEINKCIIGEYGLFVLDNPGAFAIVEHFKSFDDIMKLDYEYNIGFLKACKVDCKFTEGTIPVYNCGNEKMEGWDKNGCFYNDNQTLFITKFYKDMLEYNLGDIHVINEDMELAAISEKYITHLAYSTESSIGFYFGIVDNNWCLICLDKITPCSA